MLAPTISAKRYPLPVPPAMINSPPAVTSRSVWSARWEPGPRTLSGESVLFVAETTNGPHATPAATGAVW